MSADDMEREQNWAAARKRAVAALAAIEDPTVPKVHAAVLAAARGFIVDWKGGRDHLAKVSAGHRVEFTTALRGMWREPLDLLDYFIESVEVFGNDLIVNQPATERTLLTSVQLVLHAAACSCAHEVHWLLTGGYPTGALSRARTLHELLAVARVLQRFSPEDPELVHRFLKHRPVGELVYFKALAEHHEALGVPGPDPDDHAALAEAVEALKAAHGNVFGQDYGWAAPHARSGNFSDLEAAAGLSHRRALFKRASSEAVHVGSNIVFRHHVERPDGYERLSNATIRNLGLPGYLTTTWLWEMCQTVLDSMEAVDDVGPLITLLGLRELQADVVGAFGAVPDLD